MYKELAKKNLESALCNIAAVWRGSDHQERKRYQAHYAAILEVLMDLGLKYPNYLDPECELPDAYMPLEYLEKVARRK